MWSFKKKKQKASIMKRLLAGKLLGLIIGAVIFMAIPALAPESDLILRFGVWGWYVLLGSVIALCGIFVEYPWLKFRLAPLFRGAMIGFFLNLILGLLIHDEIVAAFVDYPNFVISYTYPVVQVALEGLIWGAFIDWICTRFGGEGKDLVKEL